VKPPDISNSVPNPERISGIYFLMDTKGDVIYIGQSKNIIDRIRTHKVEKEGIEQGRISDVNRKYKNWDTAKYIPVPENYLNDAEAAFINIYQPKCNGREGGHPHMKIKTNKTTKNYELVFKRINDVLSC